MQKTFKVIGCLGVVWLSLFSVVETASAGILEELRQDTSGAHLQMTLAELEQFARRTAVIYETEDSAESLSVDAPFTFTTQEACASYLAQLKAQLELLKEHKTVGAFPDAQLSESRRFQTISQILVTNYKQLKYYPQTGAKNRYIISAIDGQTGSIEVYRQQQILTQYRAYWTSVEKLYSHVSFFDFDEPTIIEKNALSGSRKKIVSEAERKSFRAAYRRYLSKILIRV